MRLKCFLFAVITAAFILTGCNKYDDYRVKQDISNLDDRVTKLEKEVSSLNDAMLALQTLVKQNYTISDYVQTSEGWLFTFTNGETLLLHNGDNGATGNTGQQGDSYIKSISQTENTISIVLNDSAQTTFRIPCKVAVVIGESVTEKIVVTEHANIIPLTISDKNDVASVTAVVYAGNRVGTDTQTRATSDPLPWKLSVSSDFTQVSVEVPEDNTEENVLLQIMLVKKDGNSTTASKPLAFESSYLCFTSTGNTTVKLFNKDGFTAQFKYKILNSGQGFVDYTNDTDISLTDGQKLYFCNRKASTESGAYDTQYQKYPRFSTGGTGTLAVSGNIMSLAGKDLPTSLSSNYTFCQLFYNCQQLVSAAELQLPAKTLTYAGYFGLFQECKSLTQAPKLPAEVMKTQCYSCMFYKCTSLIAAPELPSTELAKNCYDRMFFGCESLQTAPSILPAEVMKTQCYSSMFYKCTSLIAAPELPSTELANNCYDKMFFGCESLQTAPSILPAENVLLECYAHMFRHCSSLTKAPVLPAQKMAKGCYWCMFYDCKNLAYVEMKATDTSAANCLDDWMNSAGTATDSKVLRVSEAVFNYWTSHGIGLDENGIVISGGENARVLNGWKLEKIQ